MRRFLSGLAFLLILTGLAYQYYNRTGYKFGLDQLPFFKGSIVVSSTDFNDGDVIPAKFTCDGINISPNLNLKNLPSGTKNIAVVMEDGSTPSKPFTHWLMFNVKPDTAIINSYGLTGNGSVGVNDFGNLGYDGPCPPLGQTHRYYFRVYALNKKFDQLSLGRISFNKAISDHILATGTMTGVYSKSP